MNSKPTSKTFLLLADISGYTHFMRESPVASRHARQIIVRLLKSLINSSTLPLRVAELEGDAVFFYVIARDEEIQEVASLVKDQMLRLFRGFYAETRRLAEMNACECDACSTVDALKLKQILHFGDTAMERVNRFDKLFGLDVILVHKLMKNSVPSNDYVLMTSPAHSVIADFHGLTPRKLREHIDEFGTVDTVVFYPMQPLSVTAPNSAHRPSIVDTLLWKLRLKWSTARDMVGDRTSSPKGSLPVTSDVSSR